MGEKRKKTRRRRRSQNTRTPAGRCYCRSRAKQHHRKATFPCVPCCPDHRLGCQIRRQNGHCCTLLLSRLLDLDPLYLTSALQYNHQRRCRRWHPALPIRPSYLYGQTIHLGNRRHRALLNHHCDHHLGYCLDRYFHCLSLYILVAVGHVSAKLRVQRERRKVSKLCAPAWCSRGTAHTSLWCGG